MKKFPKLHQPENYVLSEHDFEAIDDFDFLLDHLTDVPASEPLRKISVNTIGLYNQKITVFIEDFEHNNQYVPVGCSINVGVDLSENRGIHMSRCVQAIFTLAAQKFKTLDLFAAELAKTVKEKQESTIGIAEVTGTYFHKRHTRKTGLESQDSLRLMSMARVTQQTTIIKTGMQVYNMTACPCTKTYTKYSNVPGLKTMGLTLQQIKQILEMTSTGTHTQLGKTTLTVNVEQTGISHKELYEVLDESVHLIYELLKRPDEHDFVQRAIKKPQFTEDVAREVVYNAYKQFKDILSEKAEITVESILQDSIHIHDVRSIIQKTLSDIKNEVEQ